MKKLLAGCAIVAVLGAVLLAAGTYMLYRAASPLIQDAREYLQGFAELGKLEERLANRSAHTPPASGELTEAQVQRFVRVQEQVHAAMGRRVDEIEQKYQHLKAKAPDAPPSMTEMLAALRDLTGLITEARRFQIDALNTEGFSQAEYSWVRTRVFQAAGIEITNMIDLSRLDDALQQTTGAAQSLTEQLPRPTVPERNRELVKPLLERLDDWVPLAFFGL